MSGSPARQWTLQTVLDRCEEVGECWLWKQGLQSKGYPQASINGKSGQSVRRHVYVDLMGKKPPGSKWCIVSRCRNRRCVSPRCLMLKSRADVNQAAYDRGLRRPSLPPGPVGCAVPKLTPELVDQIRQIEGQTQTAIAKRYGVHPRTICKILRGEAWKAPAENSVFGWRP